MLGVSLPTPVVVVLQTIPMDGVEFFTLTDPNPDRGLAWFVLNAFFLAGVGIAVMIGAGLVFGSFRLWLLNKFPSNWFNGAPQDDVSVTFRLSEREGPELNVDSPESTP